MTTTAMDGTTGERGIRQTWLWPGLSPIWQRGTVSGLLIAVGFTFLLNTALVTTFLWQAWAPPGVVVLLWFGVIIAWILGYVDIRRQGTFRADYEGRDDQLDLFLQARREYLKGEWDQAEHLLGGILRADPRDVESRLALATLYRHQERLAQAQEQLRRLQRLERAGYWNTEIQQEWERIGLKSCRESAEGSGTNEEADCRGFASETIARQEARPGFGSGDSKAA